MARCPADRMEARAAARSRLAVTEPEVRVGSRGIRFVGREHAGLACRPRGRGQGTGWRGGVARTTGRSDLNGAA